MAGAVQAAVRAATALVTGGRRPAVWRPGVSADLTRKWHSLPANRMFFMEARSKLSGPRSRRTYRRISRDDRSQRSSRSATGISEREGPAEYLLVLLRYRCWREARIRRFG